MADKGTDDAVHVEVEFLSVTFFFATEDLRLFAKGDGPPNEIRWAEIGNFDTDDDLRRFAESSDSPVVEAVCLEEMGNLDTDDDLRRLAGSEASTTNVIRLSGDDLGNEDVDWEVDNVAGAQGLLVDTAAV